MLMRQKLQLWTTAPIVRDMTEKARIKEQIQEKRKAIADLQTEISIMVREMDSVVSGRRVLNTDCPKVGCRGFLDGDYVCVFCNVSVCIRCFEIREGPEHVCSDGALQTADVLLETKACPACRSCIHKESGCDQMWCTRCHTPFSWRTGQILTREQVIHNPHYIDHPKRMDDEQTPSMHKLCAHYLALGSPVDGTATRLNNVHRFRTHVLPDIEVGREKEYRELRVRYLRNEFDDAAWKCRIGNVDRKYERLTACTNARNKLCQSIADTLRKLLISKTSAEFHDMFASFEASRMQHNERVSEIHRRSACTSKHDFVDEEWSTLQ
jgi:hypothetical protein